MVYLALQEIFGSTEIFHGRDRELEILKGIYREICRTDTSPRNQTKKTDQLSLQQSSNHSSNHENQATTIAEDDGSQSIFSFEPETRYPSQTHLSQPSHARSYASHYSQPSNHSQTHQTNSVTKTIGESIRSEKETRKTVAFISGISGSGKSALVKQFVEDLRKESQIQSDDETITAAIGAPLFLTGKFNELAGSDPYSAFVEAFSEINTLLLGKDDHPPNKEYESDLVRIRRDVKRKLGREDV